MFPLPRHHRRRGLTLVELLIVIAILGILTVVALPLIQLVPANRQTREASRALSAYFVGAQARAAELQRPVGVWIERRQGVPGEAFDLYMAEAPPPYAGDTETARCWVEPDPANMMNQNRGQATFDNQSLLLFSTTTVPFVRNGDLIRFNYRGPYFEIINIDRSNPTMGTIIFRLPLKLRDPTTGNPTAPRPPTAAPMSGHPGYPYQILRRENRSSVGSLQLPESTTIDLSVSGIGLSGNEFFPNNNQPVVIMFSPTGGIDSVRFGNSVGSPTAPVYLLIGTSEKVMPNNDPIAVATATTPEANIRELSNLWLSINHRSGKIATAENANSANSTIPAVIADARSIIHYQE